MAAETEIQMVQRHIADGERILKRQVDLIARLHARGLDTGEAEALVTQFLELQAQHRAHLARII